jgi:hypothetical protein
MEFPPVEGDSGPVDLGELGFETDRSLMVVSV